MNEKRLKAIEERVEHAKLSGGAMVALLQLDIPDLIAEVRRLQATVNQLAGALIETIEMYPGLEDRPYSREKLQELYVGTYNRIGHDLPPESQAIERGDDV